MHGGGGGEVGLGQLLLGGRIRYRSKHLGLVLAKEVCEAAESADAALDEGRRKRRVQVGADVGRDLRDRACVTDIALHALAQRCVVAVQVDVRVQPVDV